MKKWIHDYLRFMRAAAPFGLFRGITESNASFRKRLTRAHASAAKLSRKFEDRMGIL